MVSSEQFLHQLQAGKIGEALALAMSETLELDVTTTLTSVSPADDFDRSRRIGGASPSPDKAATPTENPSADRATNSGEFLRTKINLLTGEIHNEVSQELVLSGNHLKLQQFHIEQINASHQIIQSQFQQIQELLILWQQSSCSNSVFPSEDGGLFQDEVADRSSDRGIPDPSAAATESELNQFLIEEEDLDELLSIDSQPLDLPGITAPESWVAPIDRTKISEVTDSKAILEENSDPQPEDDGLNLSLDRDDEEWEEWVEDDDLLPEPIINYSPTNNDRPSVIPDWEEHWSQQHSVPISEPKPTIFRMPLDRANTYDSLEKFAPEYVGFNATTQPDRSGDLSQPIWLKGIDDPDLLDQLLADINSMNTASPALGSAPSAPPHRPSKN